MLFDGEWPKCTICAVGPAQIFHRLSRKRQGVDTFFRVNAEVPRSCGLYLVGRPEFARKTAEKNGREQKRSIVFMKQILKRGLALLVAMVLCIGLLPQGPVHVHAVSQTAGITNTVAVGDKIVIATRDGSGAMGAQNGKYRSQVAATVADRVLTVTEEIVVLTVEAGTKSGSFALKAADGYLCYDATAGGNTMHTKAEKDESASWNITFEDESAVITNVAQADRQMQYNAASPRFACYKGTQEKVAVYRVGKAPVAQVVCNHSITNFVCSKCGRVIAPDADSTLTLKQADKLGVALGGDSTIHAYYVSGTVKSIEDIYRGNITIEDAKGDTLYIYGSSNGTDQQYTLAVGDTVKIHGKIGSYKGAAQMINGKIVEYTKGSAAECQHKNVTDYVCECGKVIAPKADTTLTLTQAAKLGLAHGHNTYTEGKYYVEGVVKSIESTKYGNLTIVDKDGNTLVIYGTYSADGKTRFDAMEVQPAEGDTVKIYGVVGQYSGKAQVKNGWLAEHTQGAPEPCKHKNTTKTYTIDSSRYHSYVEVCKDCQETVGNGGDYHTDFDGTCPCGIKNVTIAQALAGKSGEYFAVRGQVTFIDGKNVYIQDETGGINIYLNSADHQIKVGDTVQEYGKRGAYKGLQQLTCKDYTIISPSNYCVDAVTVKLSELSERHLCEKIIIKNLRVVAVDGSNVTVTDDNGVTTIKIYKGTYSAETVNVGDVIAEFTGVLGIFNDFQLRSNDTIQVAPHAHTYTQYVSNNDATCTADGTKTAKCDYCDEVSTVADEGSKKAHTEEVIPGKGASCGQSGLTEGKKCSVCGTVTVPQAEIPALTHADENGDYACDHCGISMGQPAPEPEPEPTPDPEPTPEPAPEPAPEAKPEGSLVDTMIDLGGQAIEHAIPVAEEVVELAVDVAKHIVNSPALAEFKAPAKELAGMAVNALKALIP